MRRAVCGCCDAHIKRTRSVSAHYARPYSEHLGREGSPIMRLSAGKPRRSGMSKHQFLYHTGVSQRAVELLDSARAAQAAGDLDGAESALQGAIALEDLPLARMQLGGLCYADDRFEDARGHWEAAFRGFRDGG